MRFSILVATLALIQATTAHATNDSGPVEGEGQIITRQRQPAPQQQQPQQQLPPQGPQQDDGSYDDEGQEPPPQTQLYQQQQNTVIQNEQINEGVEGEFYTPGYGGLPRDFIPGRCRAVAAGIDRYTGAPLAGIISESPRGAFKLLPVPVPVGPQQINLIMAFNGLIRNGVCPGPLIPEPYVYQQYGFAQPPAFLPYGGVARGPVPLINPPRYNYNQRVYRPMPGQYPMRRPIGNGGPYAAPPGFMRPR